MCLLPPGERKKCEVWCACFITKTEVFFLLICALKILIFGREFSLSTFTVHFFMLVRYLSNAGLNIKSHMEVVRYNGLEIKYVKDDNGDLIELRINQIVQLKQLLFYLFFYKHVVARVVVVHEQGE
jgi:hypothetical protein